MNNIYLLIILKILSLHINLYQAMRRIGIILVIYNLMYTVKYNSLKNKNKKTQALDGPQG